MKKIAMLLGVLIATSLLSPALGASIDPDKIHFYMYGMKTCPHCHHMREEIPKVYGNDSLTYYEIVGNEENRKLFEAMYQYTGITGVPTIAITYNGTLYAVIEGEFNISAAPSIIEEAMKANGVLLFNGKWYIFPRNDTEAQKAINALHEIFVEHRIPSEDPTSTSSTTPTTSSQSQPASSSSSTAYETPGTSESQEGSGICGPAFVLLLVTVPVILFKKRR